MSPISAKPRVALFIDAENISHALACQIINRASEHGNLVIRRCYGNEQGLKAWSKAMTQHEIEDISTGSVALRKSATDFSLTINAVELFLEKAFDLAVIVSSDIHMAHIANYLKNNKVYVVGIGEKKAPANLITAFHAFHKLETKTPCSPATKVHTGIGDVKSSYEDGQSFLSAAIEVLKPIPQNIMRLSDFGNHMKSMLRDKYPKRKLTRCVAKYPQQLRIHDSQVMLVAH